MRWINRLFTTVTVLLVLTAPPTAAITWALAHRPWHRPGADQARAWLEHPLTATTILAAIAAAGAALWLSIIIAIVRRMISRTASAWRRLRRMPLPTPAQATAGSMAGIALFSVPALMTPPVEHTPPPPTGTPEQHLSPTEHTETHNAYPQPAGPDADPAAHGIELPDGGGWLPAHTARTVAAIANLIWLRRRQIYQPRTHRLEHRDDADLQPLPATADAVTNAYQDTEEPSTTEASTGTPLTPAEVPTGMLYLDGPGALAAARGLLVTALLAGATHDPNAKHVVITPQSLTTLLDTDHAGITAPAGLHITDDLSSAAPQRHTGPDADLRLPTTNNAVLLLTSPPTPAAGPPATTGSTPLAATTVVIGAGPPSSNTWHVHNDGTLTTAAARRHTRLCVLAPQPATDLITLIAYTPALDQPPPAHLARATDDARNPLAEGATAASGETLQHHRPADTLAVRLTLLGDCRLDVHGRRVTLRRSAALQVVAFLAIHREGATATQLIKAIWPGLNAASITQRLYSTISDLRKQLQPITSSDPLTRRDDKYHLNPDTVDADLWHLHDQHLHGQTSAWAEHDTDQTRRRHLIENYGQLAAGHDWAWLAAPRARLIREVIDAYTQLAATAPTLDRIRILQDAITVDPYNADVHRQTIHALETAGDHTGAAALSHQYARRLEGAGLTATATTRRPPITT